MASEPEDPGAWHWMLISTGDINRPSPTEVASFKPSSSFLSKQEAFKRANAEYDAIHGRVFHPNPGFSTTGTTALNTLPPQVTETVVEALKLGHGLGDSVGAKIFHENEGVGPAFDAEQGDGTVDEDREEIDAQKSQPDAAADETQFEPSHASDTDADTDADTGSLSSAIRFPPGQDEPGFVPIGADGIASEAQGNVRGVSHDLKRKIIKAERDMIPCLTYPKILKKYSNWGITEATLRGAYRTERLPPKDRPRIVVWTLNAVSRPENMCMLFLNRKKLTFTGPGAEGCGGEAHKPQRPDTMEECV